MGRVFSQFPSCGFPAAAVILAVPELSSFELTQLIHPSCSCCNTGNTTKSSFHKPGIFKGCSQLLASSGVQAGWSSQDTQRKAHNLPLWNRSWGDVKPPQHWQRSSVAPPQAQTVPKDWAHPGISPTSEQTGTRFPPLSHQRVFLQWCWA